MPSPAYCKAKLTVVAIHYLRCPSFCPVTVRSSCPIPGEWDSAVRVLEGGLFMVDKVLRVTNSIMAVAKAPAAIHRYMPCLL